MKPVNKVPYPGPTSYKRITELIAIDAKERGMDFITPSIVRSVIHHLFAKRGALQGIPYFVRASIKGFGKWEPDKDNEKLRERYYVERKRYREAFRKQLRNCRQIIRYSKKKYKEYREESTAANPLPYKYWKIASGRKKVIDGAYRKLNKIRSNWMKKEKNKFNYITIREQKRKKKWKY